MKFRDEMPTAAYIHCPRCGSECVEIPLRWTVSVEQERGSDELFFKTAIETTSVRHECKAGGESK